MKTVNSISGGKTSAYMAMHYPADYNIFSLVTIADAKCSPQDKGLVKKVSDKIGKEFIATAEDDKTLRVVFDLEQAMGREVIWIAGDTFETVIRKKCAIPTKHNRFCTQKMKVEAIGEWWHRENIGIVLMNIGFRYDEKERSEKFGTKSKLRVGKSKNGKTDRWAELEWRVGNFPLIENKICNFHVKEYWQRHPSIVFPEDSNCVGCFWKPIEQLRKNWDDNPKKMEWFAERERENKWGHTFKEGISFDQIKTIGLQQNFNFGGGSGCQADGYCTD